MFGKPNYIPEEFIIATKHGWADSRTGELLVCVKNLTEKLGLVEQTSVPVEKSEPMISETISFIQPKFYNKEKEEKVEPKAGSNDALLDLFSTPNLVSIKMDTDLANIPTIIPETKPVVLNEIISKDEPDIAQEPVKRGRGRPKVIKEVVSEAPKRGRGRPKKQAE